MKDVPEKEFNWVYRVGYSLSNVLFRHIMDSEAYGMENIPKNGPFLLACNHSSFFDPFVAGCFFKREIHFFARKTLFKPGLVSWFLHGFNSIPVDRGGADVQSLKYVLALLRRGEGLLVFPEGTRSQTGEILEPQRGVGMMACRVQAPVVPMRLFGAYESWGRGNKLPDISQPITAVYGKALQPNEFDLGGTDPNRYQFAANCILDRIKSIELPQERVI